LKCDVAQRHHGVLVHRSAFHLGGVRFILRQHSMSFSTRTTPVRRLQTLIIRSSLPSPLLYCLPLQLVKLCQASVPDSHGLCRT
jgi:hypothetical protein